MVMNWVDIVSWHGVLHFAYEVLACGIAYGMVKLIGASFQEGGPGPAFGVLVIGFAVLSTAHNILVDDTTRADIVLLAQIACVGGFVGSLFCHAAFGGDVLWKRHDPWTNRWAWLWVAPSGAVLACLGVFATILLFGPHPFGLPLWRVDHDIAWYKFGDAPANVLVWLTPYAELFLTGVIDFIWDLIVTVLVMFFVSLPVLAPVVLAYVAWQYLASRRPPGALVEHAGAKASGANAVDPG
jgi:hypothetical protein